jgi:hypothetical protein
VDYLGIPRRERRRGEESIRGKYQDIYGVYVVKMERVGE